MPNPKLHRWLDLLAALLSRRAPATFVELAHDIPDYQGVRGLDRESKKFQSAKREFERDKDEIRALGIPITTHGAKGDAGAAYQLRTKDFYLPYLALASERGIQEPKKVDRYGYHSLDKLTFEPDELEAIREGAQRAMQVGDPELAKSARSGLQKLAFDLPIGATEGVSGEAAIVAPAARPDPGLLDALGDALLRRKVVRFDYTGMRANASEARRVEPYGLFFLNGHWYLVARDIAKDALRNFRVSRISNVKVNAKKAGTPDYAIPDDFKLREHARSKHAWELGDSEGIEAIVAFHGESGAVRAASALGGSADAGSNIRIFTIRRVDSFARWLFSFAGEAVPLSPPALVDEYAALIASTREIYR